MTNKAEASVPRLKLVIRRLPPTLPEEIFWQAVAPFVTPDSSSWKRFIKGRANVGLYDHAVHSRAYVLMKSPEDLVNFHRGFDGHVFRSKTGIEYQAVVEYAPVQKTPAATKAKQDARQGTIDDDPDYKSYLESLQALQPKVVIEPSLPISQPTSTPLLEYLRSQKVPGAKGKKKQKTDSSSTDVARNAAAAVVASAARRNPKDQGAALIAGKGRAVVTVKPESKEKPVKQRPKKPKAPKAAPSVPPPSNTATNFPALGGPTGPSKTAPTATPKPIPIPPAVVDGNNATVPVQTGMAGRGGRGRGQSTAQRGTGARGRGGGAGPRPEPGEGTQTESARGSGRGRGRGEARGKSTRGMVTGILSRSKVEGPSGRGDSGAVPPPASARIDA